MAVEIADELGIAASAASEAEAAVRGADVIVTTTPAREPILKADWLSPGQHVTAMGSDQHSKGELDPACLERADLYVPDRLSQTRDLGELRSAIAAGIVDEATNFAELGDIITGKSPGRSADAAITIADLTGTGVQDTVIATYALSRADAAGAGQNFES